MTPRLREITTPAGMARAHVERALTPKGTVILGHGAGGGVDAPDLLQLRRLVDDGWCYVRVEQPWRVAGRKIATPPKTLDAAWVPVIETLMRGRWALPRPLVVGGRSAGARVACRTAATVAADAVLALSFPLHPPGSPEKSRAHEAALVLDGGLPLCVIQGGRDPFGRPEEVRAALGDGAEVCSVRGDHRFGPHPQDVLQAATEWLSTIGG